LATTLPELDSKDLRLVHAIATYGGVTKAAKRLHLSQSAVSHALARLEQRLGVALFQRMGRSLQPTPVGRHLLERARPILEELAGLEAELRRGGVSRQRLRLSTECFTSYAWLPAIVARVEQRHRDLEVRIVLEATRRPMDALERDEIDLALAFAPVPVGRWARRLIVHDEQVVALSPTHALASKRRLVPDDLRDQTMFVYDVPGGDLRKAGRVLFGEGPYPRVRKVPLTEAIVEFVAAGLGVSLLPRWIVEPNVRAGRLVARRLTGVDLGRTWSAYWRRGSALEPAIESLVGDLAARVRLAPRSRAHS
jgi:LysR family transcriptional regulator for metE and metH